MYITPRKKGVMFMRLKNGEIALNPPVVWFDLTMPTCDLKVVT